MAKPIHTVCEEHNSPLDANRECFFCAEEQENKLQESFNGRRKTLDDLAVAEHEEGLYDRVPDDTKPK